MGEKRHPLTVKEIQDAVVHTAVPCAKLIDAITQLIRLGAAKLMASLSKSANAGHALGIRLPVFTAKLLQPFHDWSPAILILVKKHLASGQSCDLLFIAILLYPVKTLHGSE
jgi:mannose/fructose/N-acetylgalactosamine-specific phosphotransferase system component IIC